MNDTLDYSIYFGNNTIGLNETLELKDGSQYSPLTYDDEALELLPAWVDRKQPNYSVYLMNSLRCEPYGTKHSWSLAQRFEHYCDKFPDIDPEIVLQMLTAPQGSMEHLHMIAFRAVILPE